MPESKDQCVKPAKGPISPEGTGPQAPSPPIPKEVTKVLARVGKPAPDFELSAFVGGGFKNIKLSDFRGQWVVLCFYPGDFTFV